jgi:hypothetical protein
MSIRYLWTGLATAFAVTAIVSASPLRAQMVYGAKMPGFSEAFGLTANPDIEIRQMSVETPSRTMVDLLLEGEQPRIVLHVINHSTGDVNAKATLRVVHYGTAVPVGDVWIPHVFKIDDAGSTPLPLDLKKGGSQDLTVTPVIPSGYGGYALVLDVPGHGSIFAATLARVVTPDPGRVQFPTYALDTEWPDRMNEGVYTLMETLGIKGVRTGAGFSLPDERAYGPEMERLDREMGWAKKHNVTVMLTLSAGSPNSTMQPLGQPRPWLTPDGTMMKTKSDWAWMPKYDDDFTAWTKLIVSKYGWPKGNLNAVELWNEPWESTSISGWGADIPRYRTIYTHMAQGVLAAREDAGVKVLVGGTSSSANARDKLFSDGKDTFLPIFDFSSIHYQALAADPALVRSWINRKSAYGPVKVWDTESWIANSEDRVAGVIASMRAQGQSRTAGVFYRNVYDSENYKLNGNVYSTVQAYPAAAAIAASQKFIGQRSFREILFRNGLPWVFVFDGLKGPEDGTVVIVGDLTKIYPKDRVLFRSVKFDEHAAMQVSAAGGKVHALDFYGNAIPSVGDAVKVPMNGLGYFLRSDGTPGSFARLLEAVRTAKITGVDPVQIVAHDMTAPVDRHPTLRVEITNVLNRSVTGTLTAQITGLHLSRVSSITLAPNETRVLKLEVTGKSAPNNIYTLTAKFNAGADGSVEHTEEMHVNWIAKRTITVDGNLADWDGIPPEILPGSGIATSMTEQAYLPYVKPGAQTAEGAATVWLAYDNQNLYFAAKIADSTPDEGMVRFATRDDNSYFYPNEVKTMDGKTLKWPDGVRHYSYRRGFDDPAGGKSAHDNVQIAFNVIDEDKKPWLPFPKGTMPHFISYWDTDYEYALDKVAPQYGGGTEVWRLLAPGTPVKSYFPREPKAAVDGGPVPGAQLVERREGNVRIVEAAIPWSEIPLVRQRVLAGQTIKFTCRVNNNKGQARELATGRSVSKENAPALHDSWQTHWANEIEFGSEK